MSQYNDHHIPNIGFGTYKLKTQEEFNKSLDAVFSNNNSQVMIDTAELYKNQHYIGNYLQDHKIKRSDVWITSKLSFHTMTKSEGEIIKSINNSLESLKTDYIDLYLLHACKEDNITPWKILRQFQKEGKIKKIGVSNFNVDNLKKFIKDINDLEADGSKYIYANQIEYNPFLNRTELVSLCKDNNIRVIAYGSFYKINKVIEDIAIQVNKTPHQVLLRWALNNNIIIIPKSENPDHIKDNMNLDFNLDDNMMDNINQLNENFSKYPRYL